MTRPLALVLSIVVMLAVAPGAGAKKPARHSHVSACAALQGAPCQARLKNSSGAIARLTILKEIRRWNDGN